MHSERLALLRQFYEDRCAPPLDLSSLPPACKEGDSATDSSRSLKSSEGGNSAKKSSRSSVFSIVSSVFSKGSSTKSDRSSITPPNISPVVSARSSIESDETRPKVEPRRVNVSALRSRFEQISSGKDARKVTTPGPAPPSEQGTQEKPASGKKHLACKHPSSFWPRPEKGPSKDGFQDESAFVSTAPKPNIPRHKVSFGHKVATFICLSANPDMHDDTARAPAPVAISAPTTRISLQPPTSRENVVRLEKRRRKKQTGMQPHPNGTRTIYVPRYTAKGHAKTTTRRKRRRRVSTKASQQVGTAPVTDLPGVQNPIALPTPSSRRPNPKLYMARAGAANDDWIQQYSPLVRQKKARYQPSPERVSSMATASGLVAVPRKKMPNSTERSRKGAASRVQTVSAPIILSAQSSMVKSMVRLFE